MKSLIKHKVVIDTNVFVSGILWGGNPEKVLRLVKESKIELVTSPETEFELLSKLKKFKVSNSLIENLISILEFKTIRFLPQKKLNITRDKKDNIFLELAWEAKADFIITGDRDLLVLKKFKKTLIIKPKQFLEIFEKFYK